MTFQRDLNVIRHCVARRFEHVTMVLSFEQEIKIQAHREAWGGVLSMATFVECEHERGAIVIFLNDCVPALAGLRKGSNKPFVQRGSEIIHELCIEHALFPMFLHVSGQALIEDGTDDGSRAKAQSLQGPECTDELWTKYKYLHTAWGIRGSQPSTCSPQHATPDADRSRTLLLLDTR